MERDSGEQNRRGVSQVYEAEYYAYVSHWVVAFAGWSLTEQDPYNNIIRTTVEAMAATLGGGWV